MIRFLFAWYSLTDQVDWDSSLRRQVGHVNPRGLFDLERNIRPVGTAYAELIDQWQSVLPAQSACLAVPLYLPSEYDEPLAMRRRDLISQCRANRRRKLETGMSVWPGTKID